jgi:Holliday junction resolvase RusA-like endonuclease
MLDLMQYPDPIPSSLVYIDIEFEGEPRTKLRARVGRWGTYTPKSTLKHEAEIRWLISEFYPGLQPDAEHRFGFRSLFQCGPKDKDLDNLAKLVMDACNTMVWADDVQVEEIFSRVVRRCDNPASRFLIHYLGD